MKKSGAEIEQSLKHAVKSMTPDVLPDVLLRIEQQKDAAEFPSAANGGEAPPLFGRATKRAAARKWAGSAAAILLLAFGGYAGYGYFTPESVISFDVNPSVDLRVNRYEKVLSAVPLAEDAERILSGMNLKNVDLNVAVNAIIGSMVKNGYVSEAKNSILISVSAKSAGKGERLQSRMTDEVNALLKNYTTGGAVLSQALSYDERLQSLAEQHNISLGKAALIDLLVSQDDTIQFADLVPLSINDINLLIASRQLELQGLASQGQASSGAYIGEERARSIALSHAGVSNASAFDVELDYDDGRMVYDVEFIAENVKYEYEIDAVTGSVMEYDTDGMDGWSANRGTADGGNSGYGGNLDSGAADGTSYIGGERARAAAFAHAGVTADAVQELDIKLEKDDGRALYEIEFDSNGMEYEYEIDALTGEIIWWEAEAD